MSTTGSTQICRLPCASSPWPGSVLSPSRTNPLALLARGGIVRSLSPFGPTPYRTLPRTDATLSRIEIAPSSSGEAKPPTRECPSNQVVLPARRGVPQSGRLPELMSRLGSSRTSPAKEVRCLLLSKFKSVIVTPAVYLRLVEFLHVNVQSTGQKSHCVKTLSGHHKALFLLNS